MTTKKWKFCTKCICRQSKKGVHFDSEQDDDFTPPKPPNESSLASVDVPVGIPAATARDPTTVPLDEDDDPIEFQGAWYASVSNAQVAVAFPVSTVDDSEEDSDFDNEVVDDHASPEFSDEASCSI